MTTALEVNALLEARAAETRRQTKVTDAIRWITCKHRAIKSGEDALTDFRSRYPHSLHRDDLERWRQKAFIGAAPTAWGNALNDPPLVSALVDVSRPLELISRIGARSVPINVSVPVVTSAVDNFSWVGGGRAKRISAAALERATLPPATASGIVVVSEDLILLAVPGSEQALQDAVVLGIVEFLDRQLVDPTNAGNPSDPFQPAAITYGVAPFQSSTGDVLEDLRRLLRAYIAAGGEVSSATVLMPAQDAVALALRSAANGGPQFPGLTVAGGTLAGLPAVASSAIQNQLIVIDRRRLLVADPGDLQVEFGRNATLEMSDAPTQHAGTGAAASQVSMFQSNSVALRLDRRVSWAYVGPIAIIDGVDYLSAGGSPS